MKRVGRGSAAFLLWSLIAALLSCPACKTDQPKEQSAPSGQTAKDAPPAAPGKTIDPSATSTVTGTVLFTGALPESTKIRATADAACAKMNPGEFDAGDVLVHDKKVENAFVWVKSGLEGYRFQPAAGNIRIEQKGCMYHPRVAGVRTGQGIDFHNADSTLHNISSKATKSPPWNFVTPQGETGTRSIKKPEVMVRVGCDVHPWMRAYFGVLDHPFFQVTGPDGKFSLGGLPPGSYQIGVWHERLGTIEGAITLAKGDAKPLDLTLPGATAH